MQKELRLPLGNSRHATLRNRVSLNCEQLEGRDAPSASPLTAPYAVVTPAVATHVAVAHGTSVASGVAVSHDVFALGGAADSGTGISDAAYAQALQNHSAAVFQDVASPAVAGTNGVVHAAAKSTTTTLTASPHTATVGEKVTLIATVTGSYAKPGGTVIFKDGNAVLGRATLDAHGVARLTTTSLATGHHYLTAVYGGNSHYWSSNSAATSLTVTRTPHPVHRPTSHPVHRPTPHPVHRPTPHPAAKVLLENVGDVKMADNPLVLEATVKGATGGNVTILDGAHTLGQIEIDRAGHAALALNLGLPAGRHTLTAVYQNGSLRASGSVSVTLTPSAMWM
jgi:hypothetical protein